MKKYKLEDLVSKGTNARKEFSNNVSVIIGESGSYEIGDILDANSTEKMVNDIIDGADVDFDTLKELEDAIPTKVSQLQNDSGYITQHQDISGKANIADLSSVATSGSYNDLENKPVIPTNISQLTNDANYVTKSVFDQALGDTSEDWYGIQWTDANTAPVRIGNMNMHRTLPIQSGMKRCMLQDDGTVYGYISQVDPTKYDDGRTADYTGAHGQVMVEIPEYHYDALKYTNDGVTTYILKLYPYYNKGKLSKKVYVSAFEAVSNDADSQANTKKLYSICTSNITVTNGSVNAAEITYTTGAESYRGGNARTTNTNDNSQNSQLGRPITNLKRSEFRTRANNRGTGWSQQYYNAHMSFVRLYVVEYCSFNSQDTFYNTTDVNGYKRGGLDYGLTNIGNWSEFNSSNPISPCGITISLGSETGVIGYSAVANSISITTKIPSYRGIENPFGHIWKWMDGININVVEDNTSYYICDNISQFADDTTTNYNLRITIPKIGEGYIKTINWDENGDFLPVSKGGSSNSYYFDYVYNSSDGWRVCYCGGGAGNGAPAGLLCLDASHDSSYAPAGIGGRLYYTPQN